MIILITKEGLRAETFFYKDYFIKENTIRNLYGKISIANDKNC